MPLQRKAPQIEVRLDGLKSSRLHVVSVHRSLGGRTLDHARLTYDTAGRRPATLVKDTQFGELEEIGSEIEILLVTGKKKTCIHWGKIPAFDWSNSASGESITFTSRLEPHHFGEPLWGALYRSRKGIDYGETFKNHGVTWPEAVDGQTLLIEGPFVFNPELDDTVYGNMSPQRHKGGFSYFLHPESLKSEPAAEYQGSVGDAIGGAIGGGPTIGAAIGAAVEAAAGKFWTLPEAVFYLCKVLNFKEKFIKNPARKDLEKVLPKDETLLRDFRLPFGETLPECLDRILSPFGYSWHVDCSKPGTRKIVVVKLGDAAAAIDLKLQAAEQALDPEKSHVHEINLTYDTTVRMANDLLLLGDFEQIEATFELIPAWDPELDETSPADLAKGSTAYEAATTGGQRAWRDWVLNEAGDYVKVRPAFKTPYDLNALANGYFLVRRRRLLPCISLNESGAPYGECHGVYVEWWDKDASAWRPLDEISAGARHVTLLRRECGIRFDGTEIPIELWRQLPTGTWDGKTEGPKIRVTATIQADVRLSHRRCRAKESVVRDPKQLLIEVPGYKFRTVHKTSVLKGVAPKSSAADDGSALQKLAEQLHQASDRAIVSGQLVLDGLEKEAPLGKPVRKLDGRKVLFRATSTKSAYELYPTIVGVTYQIDQQQILLQLDTLQLHPRT